MNKLMTEDMGRVKQERLKALGQGLRRGVPVTSDDHDSSMEDVVDKLRRID